MSVGIHTSASPGFVTSESARSCSWLIDTSLLGRKSRLPENISIEFTDRCAASWHRPNRVFTTAGCVTQNVRAVLMPLSFVNFQRGDVDGEGKYYAQWGVAKGHALIALWFPFVVFKRQLRKQDL